MKRKHLICRNAFTETLKLWDFHHSPSGLSESISSSDHSQVPSSVLCSRPLDPGTRLTFWASALPPSDIRAFSKYAYINMEKEKVKQAHGLKQPAFSCLSFERFDTFILTKKWNNCWQSSRPKKRRHSVELLIRTRLFGDVLCEETGRAVTSRYIEAGYPICLSMVSDM